MSSTSRSNDDREMGKHDDREMGKHDDLEMGKHDDREMCKHDDRLSLSTEEGNLGEVTFKKGAWSAEEDEILKEYVIKHREGNWFSVPKITGLNRSGKSCRLRWTNHLRPNLKKGKFSFEEECLVNHFHSTIGNKWSEMAKRIPGRTDNDIKNFWNTRARKRKRAGLPVDCDEMLIQHALYGNQDNAHMFTNEASQNDETENSIIPTVEFKDYKFCPNVLPTGFNMLDFDLVGEHSDTSQYGLVGEHSDSSQYGLVGEHSDTSQYGLVGEHSDSSHSTLFMRPSEQPHNSGGMTYNNWDGCGSSASVTTPFDQYDEYPMLHPLHDPIPYTNGQQFHGYESYDNNLPIFAHATPDISYSEPISMIFELPSFQYLQTQQCSLGGGMLLPSLESVDTFIQSPPVEDYESVPTYSDKRKLLAALNSNSNQNLNGSNVNLSQVNAEETSPDESDISIEADQFPTSEEIRRIFCRDQSFMRQKGSNVDSL